MAHGTKKRKVVKMKRRQPVLTGIILLLFSLYIIILTVQSVTKEHISIYEVTEKKIADDNTVRGIILREEKLIESPQAGYINYFVGEGSRVGKKTTVYSVDEDGQIYRQLMSASQDEISLTAQNTNEIRSEISSYRNAYDLSHFAETYNFKYNIENTISQLSNARIMDNLTAILEESGTPRESFQMVSAGESGIISYTSDGMEELELNSITQKSFEDMTDNLTQLRQAESIQAGNPIYRLITGENWSVVIELNKEQFNNLHQKEQVSVVLKKIHARTIPKITTFTMDGGYYARLEMNRYMIQYMNNRYLDLELELNNDEGLKIPLSSIIKKPYYTISADYVTKDQRGNDAVVVVTYDKKGTPVFQVTPTDIIHAIPVPEEESETPGTEAGNCYLDAGQFPPGTQIATDSLGSDTVSLSQTTELEGVYCCNKGYCEFRQVDRSYKNDEYCIVKKDTPNGLAAYDHIILNPELIGENDIIY